MDVCALIDHTNLKATATRDDIVKLCDEAKTYGFASVCVNTCWVPLAAAELADTGVNVCCVVGFPLGAMATEPKAHEAAWAVANGATEVDMVMNIGWLKGGNDDGARSDVAAVVEAAAGRVVKVILETCLLTEEEIVRACELCIEAGAAFVKTSTGFSTGGATPEVVALMAKTVAGRALVKAAGGIRSAEDAEAMVAAGANRLGCSSGVQIALGKSATSSY